MSLKLKRNIPLVLSLLTVLLVLTVFFGNLRVGAYNVRINLGTIGDAVSVSTASLPDSAAASTTIELAGDTTGAESAAQAVLPVSSVDLPDLTAGSY